MYQRVLILLATMIVANCSMIPKLDEVVPDSRTDYKKSAQLPDLEVPPDLATESMRDSMAVPEPGNPDSTTYAAYQKRLEAQRGEGELERLEEQGISAGLVPEERALLVPGTPRALWPKLEQYWASRGYLLELNDAELGVLETGWKEEREQGFRERYKLFVEAAEQPGSTVMYVSQIREGQVASGDRMVWRKQSFDEQRLNAAVASLGAAMSAQTVAGPAAAPSRTASTAPASSVPNAGAERAPVRDGIDAGAEPMSSSQDFAFNQETGATPASAAASDRPAVMVSAGPGKQFLNVRENFAEAWRATGQALNQAGVRVEDEDRDRGVYYVFYGGEGKAAKKGLVSRLTFWKADFNFQVSLTGVGNKTELVILNEDGQWDNSAEASELLVKLESGINKIL
jgi:outer membrane protein assembly factor BamC